MSKRDDGGFAFPQGAFDGMTMRQWYAGLAMNGWMAHYKDAEPADIATFAFGIADALIAEDVEERR